MGACLSALAIINYSRDKSAMVYPQINKNKLNNKNKINKNNDDNDIGEVIIPVPVNSKSVDVEKN